MIITDIYSENFNHRAFLLALIFHFLIIGVAAIISFRPYQKSSEDLITLFYNTEPTVAAEMKKDLISQTKINATPRSAEENLEQELAFLNELKYDTSQIVTPLNEGAVSNKVEVATLDSLLQKYPSLQTMKAIIAEKLKDYKEEKPSDIEMAKIQLKEQLMILYKDKYGDISPDKYAGQNQGFGIKIPIDEIVNFVSDFLK